VDADSEVAKCPRGRTIWGGEIAERLSDAVPGTTDGFGVGSIANLLHSMRADGRGILEVPTIVAQDGQVYSDDYFSGLTTIRIPG
jgi:hypothetical protein